MGEPDRLVEILPASAASELSPEPVGAPGRDDRCWNLTPHIQARLERRILSALLPTLTAILEPRDVASLEAEATAAIADFFPLYRRRPVADNKGGGLISDSLCLYLTVRLLRPRFLLESGTYRGHSAWLLRQAAPDAEIISCDISHAELQHREADVRYHLGDWTELTLPRFAAREALAWFDDHRNQARRLTEAWNAGFLQALFDDNFPLDTLYATGGVPVPTLAMVMDESLAAGQEISWMRHGKIYRYRIEESHFHGARARIARYLPLPDLTEITRYSPPSAMTYVALS